MERTSFAVLVAGYLTISLLVLNVSNDNLILNISTILLIGLALLIRVNGLRSMLQNKTMGYLEIGSTIFSHIILFALLFILFRDDYSITDPTNAFVDSFYYSTDTTTTNGASGITPKSGITKSIHVVNILDSYFLILVLGTFILKRIALKTN